MRSERRGVVAEIGRLRVLLLQLLLLRRGRSVGGREVVQAGRRTENGYGRVVVAGRGGEWRLRPLIFALGTNENIDWTV